MKRKFMLTRIVAVLLLLSNKSSTATETDQEPHCCLPMKWHSSMYKATSRTYQQFPRSDVIKTSSDPPSLLEVFVNYRRPRFELRSSLGSSLVFWRGHMWTFLPGGRLPQLLSRVSDGYKPSHGLAPFFFRCLAKENGFERVNNTHYRLNELDKSRYRLGSITDIYVVPSNGTTGGSSRRRRTRHTCLLASFTVVSRSIKPIENGRRLVLVQEADAYQPFNGLKPTRRHGWPDRQLTDQARSFRDYYRVLLRSSRIQLSRPHLSLRVPGHLADYHSQNNSEKLDKDGGR